MENKNHISVFDKVLIAVGAIGLLGGFIGLNDGDKSYATFFFGVTLAIVLYYIVFAIAFFLAGKSEKSSRVISLVLTIGFIITTALKMCK